MLLHTKNVNIKSAFLENGLYIYLTSVGPKVYFSHCFNQSLLQSFIVHILNSILGVYLPKNGFVFNIFLKRFVVPICWLELHIFCENLVKISSVVLRLKLAMDIGYRQRLNTNRHTAVVYKPLYWVQATQKRIFPPITQNVFVVRSLYFSITVWYNNERKYCRSVKTKSVTRF